LTHTPAPSGAGATFPLTEKSAEKRQMPHKNALITQDCRQTCEVAHSPDQTDRYTGRVTKFRAMVTAMARRRNQDSGTKTFFRTNRMFRENGEWFFTTRGGTTQGPFADREEAEKELAEYVEIMREQQAGKLTLAPREPLISSH
jgi:hypothetical protein